MVGGGGEVGGIGGPCEERGGKKAERGGLVRFPILIRFPAWDV